MTPKRIHVSVVTDSPDVLARAAEALARAAAGLALEGVSVWLAIDDEDEQVDVPEDEAA